VSNSFSLRAISAFIMLALKGPVVTVCLASIKGPVVTELTTITYAAIMLKERLCDVIMVISQ